MLDPELVHMAAYLAAEVAVASSFTALRATRGLPQHEPSELAKTAYTQHLGRLGLGGVGRPELKDLFLEAPRQLQKKLTSDVYKYQSDILRTKSPQIAHRLDSCSGEAAALITAIPTDKTNTISDGDNFRERLSMRLDVAVPYIMCGPCNCKKPGSKDSTDDGHVDCKGYHTLSVCRLTGNRIHNHNMVRDTFMEYCRAGNYTCRPEDGQVMQADAIENTKSKVDIVVDNFDGAISLGIDVSIIDPRQSAYINLKRAMVAGKAGSDREAEKVDQYGTAYKNQNSMFSPFVMEAFARFAPVSRELFNKIAVRVHSAQQHYPLHQIKKYWRQRLVMALHISASNNMKTSYNEVLRRRSGLVAVEEASPSLWARSDMGMFGRCRH